MKPFNVRVGYGDNEVTLTILPEEEKQYKVIYYGSVLGAIRQDEFSSWEVVPDDEVIVGDLPPYEPDYKSDRIEFVLNEDTAEDIGEEIQNYKYNPDPADGPSIDPIR